MVEPLVFSITTVKVSTNGTRTDSICLLTTTRSAKLLHTLFPISNCHSLVRGKIKKTAQKSEELLENKTGLGHTAEERDRATLAPKKS